MYVNKYDLLEFIPINKYVQHTAYVSSFVSINCILIIRLLYSYAIKYVTYKENMLYLIGYTYMRVYGLDI